MKKPLWIITVGILLIGTTSMAGDGDLIVNGKLGLRSTNPTGIFEILGQVNVSSNDAIPTMTSNTAPSGIASADSNWSSDYQAWRAMNDTNADPCWHSGPSAFPHWLQYQFASGKIITSYSITTRITASFTGPKDWKLQGSTNGTAWVDLDTQTGQSFNYNEKKTFSFSNSTSYSYYRLYVTAGDHSSLLAISEFELMEAAGTQSVSLLYVDETTGNVGIWSNNPGNYKLYVNGAMYASSYSGSDRRWKKNIKPIGKALSLVEKLQGVRFEWRTDEFKDKHFEKGGQVGLIAQEVEPLIPEIVKTDQDGYKAISYDKLTVILLEAIKEQNQKIKELEVRIKKKARRKP